MLKLRSITHELVEWKDGTACWTFPRNKYKVVAIWSVIRLRNGKVTWHKLVWFSLNLPKHAFVSWLTVLNKLPTMDQIMA